jgi:hypothetical protein
LLNHFVILGLEFCFIACQDAASVGRESHVFEGHSPHQTEAIERDNITQHGGLTSSRSLSPCLMDVTGNNLDSHWRTL